MLLFINISTLKGGNYYDLFYFLSIIFSLVALIIAGKKRNYPMIPWMLSLLVILLFLILGTKIFTLSPEQWADIFHNGRIPANTGRTILGGIAGCMIGLFISRLYFGFKNDVFDVFAYVFPVAMAIQRVGCLFAGCCFGTPANVPWAVVYPRNTFAHAAHVNSGFLDYYSPFSLPVHPNPLYQILACILIIFLLYYLFSKRIRVAGNMFLTSIALYLISRVINEFFRDASSNGYTGETVFGLKIIQWLLIVIVTGTCIIILLREKTEKYGRSSYYIRNNKLRNALFFLGLFILIVSIWNWLPGIEHVHIFSVSLSLGVFSLVYGFRKLKEGKWQWSMLILIPFSLFLISWGSNDSPDTGKEKKDYISIGMGYIGGKYDFHYKQNCPPGSWCCSGPVYYRKATYNVFGGGISYTHYTKKERTLLFGGNLSLGTQCEKDLSGIQTRSVDIIGFNPRFLYEGKYLGLGLGFHCGEFYEGYWLYEFFPQIELRFGQPKDFYISGKIGDQFPGLAAHEPYAIEIGSGFGTDKFLLNVGLQFQVRNYSLYIKPRLNLLKNQLTLKGYYNSRIINEYLKKYNEFGLNIWWNLRMK